MNRGRVMKLLELFVAISLPACGSKASNLEGSWSGPCKRDDGAAITDSTCVVTIGAKSSDGYYPVHVEAASGEVSCDGEAPFEDNRLVVMAPKACASEVGRSMSQYSISPNDGAIAFLGGFGTGGGAPLRFEGKLGRAAAAPAEMPKPRAAPASAPAPMAPPRP